VLDHRGVRDAGVRAADLLGDLRVEHRQALDVGLVDDALVVLVARGPVVAPVEERVDDDRVHRVTHVVVGVDLRRRRGLAVTEGVGVERLVVLGLPLDRLGVRVEQELARVAAVTAGGVVRPVHAEAVALPGLHVGHVAVPHEAVRLGQVEARLVEVIVEEAQLDAFGDLGEDGDVDPRAVVRRSEWVGLARPDLHGPSSVVRSRQGPRRHGVATCGRRWPHSAFSPAEARRAQTAVCRSARRAGPRARAGRGRRCSAGASLLPVPHEGDLRTRHAAFPDEEAAARLDRVGVAGDPGVGVTTVGAVRLLARSRDLLTR